MTFRIATAASPRLAAIVFALALAAGPADAGGGDVREGERVRVWAATTPPLKRAQAMVVHVGAQDITVRLDPSRALAVIPYGAIARLEASAGRHGHPWRGALVGAVIGIAAAFVADEVRGRAYHGDVADPLLFSLGGAVLGGALGQSVRTERWERVR